MDLYKFHSKPKSLHKHDEAHNTNVDLIAGQIYDGKKLNSAQEKVIGTHPYHALKYAKEVIKGRFPEGEKAIATGPYEALQYARDVIKGRFPEGEEAIATDSKAAMLYAKYVIKGRWPEGERVISRHPTAAEHYSEFVKEKES